MVKLSIQTKPAQTIHDFIWDLDRIRPHQVYFQKLSSGDFIARVTTNMTNVNWVENEIKFGRIYLPLDITFAEKS